MTIVEDRARNGVIRVAEADLPADRNEDSTLVGHADTAVKPSASALVVNSAEEAQQWGEVASTTEAAQAPIVVQDHSAIADQQCTAALNTTGSVLRPAMRADLPCRAEGIDSLAERVQRSDTDQNDKPETYRDAVGLWLSLDSGRQLWWGLQRIALPTAITELGQGCTGVDRPHREGCATPQPSAVPST